MTTFTNKELIKEIKERISSLEVRDDIERRAYEIALASLEAKPIGAFHIAEQQVDGTSDYLKDGEWPINNGIIEVYAAPPVPVVPEEKPMPNPLSMYAVDAVAAIAEVRGWNACRAAMLYGAVPASKAYKLPQTQFKQVADLYEMQFDDGRTCAFHTDAQKAVQWLQACDGNRVQEYVKLERLQNALSGNSPVTPDGWVMVPKRLTAENGAKGALSGEFSETTFISCLECFGDDDCDTCDGSGRIEIKVPVTWSTIKSIWDKGIEYFAAKPSQEVK
ncbi:hypothetical protein KST30_17750 [Escherichia coli]|nr:hypothetical protein [Escherichia coli]MCU6373504.1 hypothetical protein [Escherichia coli]MCU6381937.1 hypothetical protein [Escherichia coli]